MSYYDLGMTWWKLSPRQRQELLRATLIVSPRENLEKLSWEQLRNPVKEALAKIDWEFQLGVRFG